ncbi:ParA family partition ATPase [Xanthobacter sp. KR7-65]|uniref:ParA family partition ATPase n=1 Tax=Xanthobacter sp. KR7-65 TaxID=3156612 RepID=UPI0032B3B9F2
MIYGVLNQKGGAGKTTISTNLAAAMALAGHRTLLVDADPQGSALAWSSARRGDPLFPVVGMPKPTLHKDLPEIARDYEFVFIDGAPRVSELGRAAIMASDFVLIPVQPSPYDVWAAAETVQLIREARQFKESLQAAFVINRKIVNTALGNAVVEALAEFEDVPALSASVAQRVIYAESAGQGLSVMEADPRSEAAREIGTLARLLASHKERKVA